jgi:general secretion pathway protein D
MNSVHNPISSSSETNSRSPSTEDVPWLEVFSNILCWIGIVGLIALITQSAWAQTSNRSGFLPGVKPVNPSMPGDKLTPGDKGFPSDSPTGNPMYYGDEEDDFDDDDDDFAAFPPPGMNRPGGGSFPGGPGGTSGSGGDTHNFATGPSGGGSGSSGPRTFSAGGAPSTGPDPVKTAQGYSLGGTPANGVISNPQKRAPLVKIDDETAEGSKDLVTDFNFPDAEIMDIAKTLGKLTGKNFILDNKDVKGKITIISNSPITVGEAWKVFLTALDINGFALIPSGKYLRIAKQRDARDKQLKTYTGDFSPDTDALITRVFPLKYISSEEVARTFRSFMPANSRIIPYDQTNTVIVTDTGSNISKLAKMLEILDVEGYDAGIEVIPVKYASAAELSKLIDTLIPGTSTGAPGAPGGGPRFGGGAGGRFSARRTKEGGIINTIISDDRTNTLIVHANTKGADQVRELVAKLDQKVPSSQGGGRVHVYYLQFADAEQIANTLNNFSSQTGSRTGAPTPGGGGGTGSNPIASSLFEGSIKVAPDKSTNALVITASPADFVTVQRVINKLDIPRNQVYVEVAIIEVSLGKNFEFSSNIVSPSSGIASITSKDALTNLVTGNFLNNSGGLISIPLGKDTTINVNGASVPVKSAFGLVKLVQGNNNTNVLATPQIIALDNSEATFESSEKVPVATNTITATGLSQTTPTKESVTLSIKIKPQINKITNFVKMEVQTKLADIDNSRVPSQLQGIAFGSVERNAQTTVVVGDSDTVVLGGLIRDKIQDTENKIPILGDIPILGWLFKSKITSVAKTNLLIFMTPYIVRQYDKVRAILDRKLKERDEFIETTAGGDDPLRGVRDNMIRNLPDIKELSRTAPSSAFSVDEEKPAAVAVESPSGTAPAAGANTTPGTTSPAVTTPAGMNANTPASAPATGNTAPGAPVGGPETAVPPQP